MKKFLILLLFPSLVLLLATSCDKGSNGKGSLLPNITGTASEVIVSMNRNVIKDSLGKTIKNILDNEYPMIPQSEPLFNSILVPSQNFSSIFKTHRNIILIKVGNEFEKAQLVPQRDVWSTPQLVINVVGPSYPAIQDLLKKDKDKLIQMLEQAERNRTVQNAIKFEAQGLRVLVENKFKASMNFPKGYTLKLDTTNFVWISNETPSTSQGIFIYEYPYTDANTFTTEYLIAKRDSFLNKYVPGPTKGSYMITQTLIPPTFQSLMYKDRYFGQVRGLWDVHAHPMGGPFISLTTIDEENNRVITVDGYVYAPKREKRNYMRQIEALLLNISLAEGKDKKE